MPRGDKQRAKGLANAHNAVALVREWGGALPLPEMQARGLDRGARRAVKLGLLVKNRAAFVLNEGVADV